MNHILFPTDFSQPAKNALDFVLDIAKHYGSQVTLLHVYEGVSRVGGLQTVERFHQLEAEKQMAALAEYCGQALNQEGTINTKITRGKAVEKIVQLAQKGSYDLIAMGTQGGGAVREVFIGSTTSGVMKASTVPLLAIPDEASFQPFQRIMLSADDQPIQRPDLFQILHQLTASYEAEILVFHYDQGEELSPIDASLTEALDSNTVTFHFRQSQDDVHTAIQTFAERQAVDLICLIHRERPFWETLFRRSATKDQVFRSEVPLLILRE